MNKNIKQKDVKYISRKELPEIQKYYLQNYLPALTTEEFVITDADNTSITMLELKMCFPFVGINSNGQNFTSLTEENYQKILSKIGDVMAEYLGYIDFITPEQAAKSNLPDFDNKGVLIHQGE